MLDDAVAFGHPQLASPTAPASGGMPLHYVRNKSPAPHVMNSLMNSSSPHRGEHMRIGFIQTFAVTLPSDRFAASSPHRGEPTT